MQKRSIEELKLMATAVRMLSVDMIAKANSGHPGLPLGFADVATILFTEILKYDAKNPKWFDRDRFVLSAGHGSALLYSLLYLSGYEDCDIEDLKQFRQLHSKTAGHPEYGYLKGIETTTGPLGQGVANAVGMAIAQKMAESRFGKDICNHKVYCMVGDGCLMEGISYESLNIAGHLSLNNLVLLWDNNEITIDGSTTIARTENMKMRMESNGFLYLEANGHDFDSIRKAFEIANSSTSPVFIAFKTIIGIGCATKQGTSKCHGSPIKGDELDALKSFYNWKHAPFDIPTSILKMWNESGINGELEYSNWNKRVSKLENKTEFLDFINKKLKEGWQGPLNNLKKEVFIEKPIEATRKSSNRVLEILTNSLSNLIGGSADLTGSVLTQTTSTKKAITKDDFSGRYLNYGVREHAMAGIMNGIALHSGFIPYGGTFFCFADYEKPAIRLSALMKLPILYVLTHDSIGLGEDGPTHQAVEQLAMLRATPNLNVFRPSNLIETIECYEIAIKNSDTPSALVFSRQNVNFFSTPHEENLSEKGMYIFSNSKEEPNIIIIATGTEVELAMKTKTILEQNNFNVRVVSAPCWRLFDLQSPEYKKFVLGSDNILKVAIEAGSSMGWCKYIGKDGLFFGIPNDSFGMSGVAEDVYKYFGLTPENIANKIQNAKKNKQN